MSAGIKVYNDNNILIIDEQNVCLCLRYSDHLVAGNLHPISAYGPTNAPLKFVDITYSGGDSPLLVIRKTTGNSSYAMCMGSTYDAGSNVWTFRVGVVSNENSYDFSFFIYDRPGNSLDGFKVYDASGRLTFSTVAHILRVVSVIPVINSGTFPLPNGVWGFAYLNSPLVDNYTVNISDSDGGGGFHSVELWNAQISGFRTTSNSYQYSGYTIGSGTGRYDYTYAGPEAGGASLSPALIVDLATL